MLTFAYGKGIDNSGNECLYIFGGTKAEFWLPGTTGPYTVNTVQKYCPAITSTQELNEYDSNIELFSASPNPAYHSTIIRFELKSLAKVSIKINDVSGREILNILDSEKGPGIHEFSLTTSGLPNGLYYCTIKSKGTRKTVKLVVFG